MDTTELTNALVRVHLTNSPSLSTLPLDMQREICHFLPLPWAVSFAVALANRTVLPRDFQHHGDEALGKMIASSATARGLLPPPAPPTRHTIEELEFFVSLEGSEFCQCIADIASAPVGEPSSWLFIIRVHPDDFVQHAPFVHHLIGAVGEGVHAYTIEVVVTSLRTGLSSTIIPRSAVPDVELQSERRELGNAEMRLYSTPITDIYTAGPNLGAADVVMCASLIERRALEGQEFFEPYAIPLRGMLGDKDEILGVLSDFVDGHLLIAEPELVEPELVQPEFDDSDSEFDSDEDSAVSFNSVFILDLLSNPEGIYQHAVTNPGPIADDDESELTPVSEEEGLESEDFDSGSESGEEYMPSL